VPGAVAGGVAWTVPQVLGTYLVRRSLHSDSVYRVFGTVLGLLAWIYLAVEITVCAAEINVVLARRLWPRSIVQPPLTEADRAVLAAQALQNQRRDDQHVDVSFDDPAAGVSASGTTRRSVGQLRAAARVPQQPCELEQAVDPHGVERRELSDGLVVRSLVPK
jgi:virulence factor BrkB